MKKLILALSVLCFATTAKSQTDSTKQKPLTICLTQEEVNSMVGYLQELPYKQAAPLMNFFAVKVQEAEQQLKVTAVKEEEKKPTSKPKDTK